MLDAFDLHCPYCGEPIEMLVDASAGDQHYIEDCQVCCQPITVNIVVDAEGDLKLRLSGENDA
ncbi:MAG: CPXCG motif-containing cysteine-rich protein [Dyella sp.]